MICIVLPGGASVREKGTMEKPPTTRRMILGMPSSKMKEYVDYVATLPTHNLPDGVVLKEGMEVECEIKEVSTAIKSLIDNEGKECFTISQKYNVKTKDKHLAIIINNFGHSHSVTTKEWLNYFEFKSVAIPVEQTTPSFGDHVKRMMPYLGLDEQPGEQKYQYKKGDWIDCDKKTYNQMPHPLRRIVSNTPEEGTDDVKGEGDDTNVYDDLGKAAGQYLVDHFYSNIPNAFIAGAKWQASQSSTPHTDNSQEVIGFAEWTWDNSYIRDEGDKLWYKIWTRKDKQVAMTTEELYQLFKNK